MHQQNRHNLIHATPQTSALINARRVTAALAALALNAALTVDAEPSWGEVLKPMPSLPAPLTDQDFIDAGQNNPALFELGRQLFFDPILSGNRNISCGTCHDPSRGTGDGVALSIVRRRRRHRAVAPNRGRRDRPRTEKRSVAVQHRRAAIPGVLSRRTAVGNKHPRTRRGFRQTRRRAFAARSRFFIRRPGLVPGRLAGGDGRTSRRKPGRGRGRAVPAGRGKNGAWDLLAERLRRIPAYVEQFRSAFAEIDAPEAIRYSHAARALAHFQAQAFRSTNSRFDKLLETRDASSWSARERQGLHLFYGKAGCANCHAGALLTDHEFHAIAMPQIGPGKGHGSDRSYLLASGFADRLEDEGRYRATLNLEDQFRFRTPSLRNVALTGPWGHAGAYDTLTEVVKHHLRPVESLHRYSAARAESVLPALGKVLDSTGRGSQRRYHLVEQDRRAAFDSRRGFVQGSDPLRTHIARANELPRSALSDREVASIVAFLHTLSDPGAQDQSHLIPPVLPSGLTPQPQPPATIR